MSLFSFGAKSASVLWIEPHRLHTGGSDRAIHSADGLPSEDELAQALTNLPTGPTQWIVDDLMAPSVLIRDIVELPPGAEARDAFFHWRFKQAMALDTPHAVQALALEDGAWLLAGMPETQRDAWVQLGLKMGRSVHVLLPRWLWLYNRLAPSRTMPGMLLSLCQAPGGKFTGTLAAWGRNLTLLRQWSEPADPDAWISERILPSSAFLQRENRSPQEIWVWGAPDFPPTSIPLHMIQPEIPVSEAL